MSIPRIRVRLVVLTLVFVVIAWAGNAAVLAFDEFGYQYTDSISLGQLAGEMFSIDVRTTIRGFFSDPFFGMINMAMLLSIAAIALSELVWRQARPVTVFVITALSMPVAALALYAIFESWSLGLDGEWLGEGWPIFEGFFFWTVALVVYSVFELRQIRTSRSPASTSDLDGQPSRASSRGSSASS